MLKKEGWRGFYKGFNSCIVATFASYAIYFFNYRMWKNILTQLGNVPSLDMKHIAFVTALSGLTSSIFSNPFWLVNTRMMNKDQNKTLV